MKMLPEKRETRLLLMPRRDARTYPGLYFTQYFCRDRNKSGNSHPSVSVEVGPVLQLSLYSVCVFSYMLILDEHLQLWFVWYVEHHTYSTFSDDVTRILHLRHTFSRCSGNLIELAADEKLSSFLLKFHICSPCVQIFSSCEPSPADLMTL